MNFECPHCGQHYEADESYYGMEINCEVCKNKIYISYPGYVSSNKTITLSNNSYSPLSKEEIIEKEVKDDFTCNFSASIITTIFIPLLGLISLFYAFKSWELKKINNLEKSKEYSIKSRNAVKGTWFIFIILFVIWIINFRIIPSLVSHGAFINYGA